MSLPIDPFSLLGLGLGLGRSARRRGRAAEQGLPLEVDDFGAALDLTALDIHLAVDEGGWGADLRLPGRVGTGSRVDPRSPHLIDPALPAPRQSALALRLSCGRIHPWSP